MIVYEKDRAIFRKMVIKSNNNPSDFNFHIYDIWPLAYTYLLQQGYTGGWGSEEIYEAFGLPKRGDHDAFEDCRYSAIVLRKILQR